LEPVSWERALSEIADRLDTLRRRHGGRAFAFYGGGGQGNHLGGVYGRQLLRAMKSRFMYNALAQEKTGDFWVNGRLFGDQRCHITEDVEHADFVMFIGTNPFQAHGIPNARDTLRLLSNHSARTMVVIDPCRTETARLAKVHLQLKPGTDAFLLSAMLAFIVRERMHDRTFLEQRCVGFEALESALKEVPIVDYVRRADVSFADFECVARALARARSASVRVDLGIQQSLHSTLNSYLEKLLFLMTGNFGKPGANNFHCFVLPLLGHSDERARSGWRTARHGMFPIAGFYPPNILPDEIEGRGEDRVRALFVDSANPVLTGADSTAYEQALKKLELLVVVDVAMTETARLAHCVLPAATQFEKWECTGFNLEFPQNAFHLRHPLLSPRAGSLPEAEIYTRLLEAMGEVPKRFPLLERVARVEPAATRHLGYLGALGLTLARNRRWAPYAASIAYRSLGPALRSSRAKSDRVSPAAAAPLLALTLDLARKHGAAVRRAGRRGNWLSLGTSLFHEVLDRPEGVVVTQHQFADTWSFIRHPDGRIHLDVPEMLAALRALRDEPEPTDGLVLIAGERRAYNANQIYRDPAWRKTDAAGAMRVHSDDAKRLGLVDGGRARCRSTAGEIEVIIRVDDAIRPGVVTLPHGYGARYQNGPPSGPELNKLTSGRHCDVIARTPFHKYVPVSVEPIPHDPS
jgi:anaerobic selenocysteine-containing dehydrogenase